MKAVWMPVEPDTYRRLVDLERQMRLETRVVYADAVAKVLAAYRECAAREGVACTP